MKRVALFGLAVVWPVAVAAQQPVRVQVEVRDEVSGIAVAGIEVFLDHDRRVTGPAGRVVFSPVSPGVLALRVRALGYRPVVRQLEVLPGEDRLVSLDLEPLPVAVDSIIVAARPGNLLTHEELRLRGPTLAGALDGWQGLVVSRDGAGHAYLQLRGSAPEEVLVLFDGFPLNDPLSGRADLSHLATGDVASVSVQHGARSTEGRRAIAGVVQIRSRTAPDAAVGAGFGSYGEAHARLAASRGRGSLGLNALRLAREFPFTARSGAVEHRQNAGGEIVTLHGSMRGAIELSVRAGWSRRGLPGTTVNPTPYAATTDRSAFIGLRSRSRFHWNGSLQWINAEGHDRRPPPGFAAWESRTSGVGATGGIGYTTPAGSGDWVGAVAWSLDGRLDWFDGTAVRPGSRFEQVGFGASGQWSRPATRGAWRIESAVRLDWWTGRDAPALSTRLDLGWSHGGTDFSLGGGSAVTAPALGDLLFREGIGVRVNPDLRPERVRWEVEAALSQETRTWGIPIRASVRGYYGLVNDLVLWTPDFRFVWSPGNFDVRRRGGAVEIEARPAPTLQLSATTTWNRITYDQPGGAQVRYRPGLTHAMLIAWHRSPWSLGLRWHHLGERYPNNVGTNPLPAADLVGITLERRVSALVTVRVEGRDLLDARPAYVAGYPSPGRGFYLQLNLDLP